VGVLSRAQRKELLDQVRGRMPLEPARLPLARLIAEQRLSQRTVMVCNTGLAVGFAGQWITAPSPWRVWFAIAYAVLLAAAWPLVLRQTNGCRRFLAEHPADS
jgi:hypothetical protein